jgi:transmembrane sensor
MKTSDYIILLHKKLSGDIEPSEEQALERWLHTQPDKNLADEMEQAWSLTNQYKSGYEPNTQRGLADFKAQLNTAEASAPFQPKRFYLRPYWWAAAASLLLVAAGLWWWASPHGAGAATEIYATEAGETRTVNLPDGSTAVLNASSQLAYSTVGNERRASFSGEAFFSIASNPDRPFVVSANGTDTRVMGTAFNLRAYPEEPTVEVEVKEGKVELAGPSAVEAILLTAKERGICKPKQGKLYKVPSENLHALAWHTNDLQFTAEPFGQAMLELERYYRIDLELTNEQLADCLYNGAFSSGNIEQLLTNLELVFGFKVSKVGERTYRLERGRCR